MANQVNEFDGVHDEVILQDEIARMDDLVNKDDGAKRQIILDAAEHLVPKYEGNKSVIASKLQAIFAKDRKKGDKMVYAMVSKTYIYNNLPDEYKRAYTKPEKTKDEKEPANLFEEALVRLHDICKDMASVFAEHLEQVQDLRASTEPKDQTLYQELVREFDDIVKHEYQLKVLEDIKAQMSTSGQTADFIEMLKQLQVEADALKKLTDHRRKFSTAAKINLKMIFTFKLLDDTASKLNNNKKYGAKWLASIKKDPVLDKFTKLINCPCCGFNFDRWIEKANSAQEMGLELPPIDKSFCEVK